MRTDGIEAQENANLFSILLLQDKASDAHFRFRSFSDPDTGEGLVRVQEMTGEHW